MKHTPTPWKEEVNSSGRTYEEIHEIFDARGEIACYVPFNRKEDAAFIVHAVNCHEKLVRALNRLHDHAHNPCVSDICFAKEAIALAETNS